jgi:DNA-binding SARP family transcriptional activator
VTLRLGILGPLSLVVDGEEVQVPGPKRRAVLAMLAITPGRLVPGERLLDAVWPDEVPASGRRALHSHMSRIRGHLGPAAGRLTRDGEAYGLDLGPGELDAEEARSLAAAAARAVPTDAVRGSCGGVRPWWSSPTSPRWRRRPSPSPSSTIA